jgi:NADH/NAD ratio-sensing transcriptional regulator Rex
MSDAQSKLQRLEDAGILERKNFTPEELTLVDQITDDEIDVLVRLRQKLGAPAADKNHIRPNIFV